MRILVFVAAAVFVIGFLLRPKKTPTAVISGFLFPQQNAGQSTVGGVQGPGGLPGTQATGDGLSFGGTGALNGGGAPPRSAVISGMLIGESYTTMSRGAQTKGQGLPRDVTPLKQGLPSGVAVRVPRRVIVGGIE